LTRVLLLLTSGALVLSAVSAVPPVPPRGAAGLLFRDIAAEAGVDFQRHGAAAKKYIMESMSGGLALLDFDNDGFVDIYLTDAPSVETALDPRAARSALYRNRGTGTFEDVTERAGIGHPGWAMGVCTADVDGDGWEDIYVTGFGRNALYRNNRNGTFTDIAEPAGVAGGGWSTGCGFADYDRDGDLDLFVSRYVTVDLDCRSSAGEARGSTS
jgi:enediyne biosynthesis protein E4